MNRLIILAKEHKVDGDQLQFLTVDGASGSRQIAYRFSPPAPGQPVLMWFCGFKSHMESEKASALAAWARPRGLGCLRFDYSGHGKSGGRFEDGTISQWLAEAEAVADLPFSSHSSTWPMADSQDKVRRQSHSEEAQGTVSNHEADFRGSPLIFVGSSMGGGIALLLARRMAAEGAAPKAAVLIAPAWDMTRLMWENGTDEARAALLRDGVYFRPSAYSGEPYAITRALIDDGAAHLFGQGPPMPLAMPVRIIHGQRDADIPWRHSVALLDVLGGNDVRLTLVKDGEHRLSRPEDLALLFSTLSDFLPPHPAEEAETLQPFR